MKVRVERTDNGEQWTIIFLIFIHVRYAGVCKKTRTPKYQYWFHGIHLLLVVLEWLHCPRWTRYIRILGNLFRPPLGEKWNGISRTLEGTRKFILSYESYVMDCY